MEFIENESELEERLSRPSELDIEAASRLEGDLMMLGAGGKMGPSLARLARRALQGAGSGKRVLAVSRFSDATVRTALEACGVETIECDLLNRAALERLPQVPNVIFMAARKFGTTGAEFLTWAMNTYLPGLIAEKSRESRIVAFSTGNVYPMQEVAQGGATEETPVQPQGEYGQSALGRERLFEYGSNRWGTRVTILRLNYAIDMRYGVLSDIGRAVFEQRPVSLEMGAVNVIWQRDANSAAFRSFEHCASPPCVLNLSGPETLSVRYLAGEFGKRFTIEPIFSGTEEPTALLTNAAKAHRLLGYPSVSVSKLIDWTAHWIQTGGTTLGKPTHFQVRDGAF